MALRRIRIWGTKKSFAAGALALVVSSVAFSYAMFAPFDPYKEGAGENVIVEAEDGASDIVDKLEEEGYVKHPILLRVAVAIGKIFRGIENGAYYISQGMSDWEIFRSLANPDARYVKIAAGMRKEELADFLAKRLEWDEIQKREFANAHLNVDEEDLEGKYFPDTYLLPVGADPREVAMEMVENYEEQAELLKRKYPNSTINHDTAIIIASIIQREAAGPHDMRLISGIIWNRMFKGMSLSMDATIQYARGKTEKGWWAPIKASDIRTIDSPYNTYKNDGLPPTPIANPSLAAIEAALNPQRTDCLYYLHDRWRRIHCSTSGEGHERNVQTYLR